MAGDEAQQALCGAYVGRAVLIMAVLIPGRPIVGSLVRVA